MEPIRDPGIELTSLMSPALAAGFYATSTTGEAHMKSHWSLNALCIEQWLCILNYSVFPSLDLFLLWNDFTEKLKFSDQSLSHVRLFTTSKTEVPCPSSTPGACSNSCPLCCWCHPTISSSVVSFSSRLQSFPASGSSRSQFFASGGQSIGVSASTSVLPMNIQDGSPLG